MRLNWHGSESAITTIPDAIRQLSREQLADVAAAAGSIDYFQHIAGWEKPLEHLRLHAMATQRATDLLARMLHRPEEIAADMGLSASTVRTHCHNVYRRLGVSDRSQAVLHATARGWL